MLSALLLAAAAATPAPDALDRLAAAFRSGRAWAAAFAQEYLPEGFDRGTTEHGTVTIAPPAGVRFDYISGAARVFASDGAVGRLVDPGAGSCDAVRLDQGVWARLPLSALLDPAAARRAFTVAEAGGEIRLVPKEPSAELAQVSVSIGADGLPSEVTVTDGGGNRNRFAFTGWRPVAAPTLSFFRPALPGAAPCLPDQ